MNITRSKIVAVKELNKVVILKIEKGGKELNVKCWKDHPLATAEVGTLIPDGTATEQKENTYNGQTTTEVWLSSPKKASGSAGGRIAKSDPAKNQTIRDANEKNNDTIARANRLNNAVAALTCANNLMIALIAAGKAPKDDPLNTVIAWGEAFLDKANDMADGKTLREMLKEAS